jgi:flagellar protein FliO/FliZ
MFTTLFGSELPLAARFFIAFLVVLALIGVTAWLVRRFGVKRLGGNSGRGRQPRLAVIDAATVDGRRRLVLIRRDNIEHLLMIGGPTDVVIEPNIIRAAGAREVVREPGRAAPSEPSARVIPPAENGWPLQPANEPPPLTASRSQRPSATEEPWHAPEPGARPRPADTLTGLAAELSSKLNRPESAPPPQLRPEPRASAAPPVEPASTPQDDQNLAAMAQQLEAALRRPAPSDGRPPVTDPLAAPAANAQSKAPSPAREVKARAEPKPSPKVDLPPEPKVEAPPAPKPEPKREAAIEPPLAPRREQKIEAKPEPKPAPKLEPAAAGNEVFDSLEEEMANLLGRPAGKS